MKFFQFVLQYFQKVNPATGRIYTTTEVPCDPAWFAQAMRIVLKFMDAGKIPTDCDIIAQWYEDNPNLKVKETPWGWIEDEESQRKVADLTVTEFEALLRAVLGK